VKVHSAGPPKPPSKGQAHAVDLSEPRNLLRLGTFVILGSLAASIMIGACRGSLDAILCAMCIAGAISLIFWLVILPVATLMLISEALRLVWRRRTQQSPEERPGVADEWLDGPA